KKQELVYTYTRSSDIEGRTNQVFEGYDGVRHVQGSWSLTRDGSVQMDYTSQGEREEPQVWNYTIDAEGAGKGTWSWHNVTCDLRFNNFRCQRKACSVEGAEGACTPPVALPTL